MKKHSPVSLLLILLLSLTPAFAQDGATIKGSVTDPKGQIEGRKEPGSTVIYRELVRGRMSASTTVPANPESATATEMAVDHRGLLIGWSQPSGGSSPIHLRRRK